MIGVKAAQLLILCQTIQQITALQLPKLKLPAIHVDLTVKPPILPAIHVDLTGPGKCPEPVNCKWPCVPVFGEDGCDSKCDCSDLCNDKQCEDDETCVLQTPFICDEQCDLVAECIKKLTCSGSPNTGHCSATGLTLWTYNESTGTCERFLYYGCYPSPNTFIDSRQCAINCMRNPA